MSYRDFLSFIFCVFLFVNSKAQDSVHIKNVKGNNSAIKKKRHNTSPISDEQRKEVKIAEDLAIYQRQQIRFDPNYTPLQRREKIKETKINMIKKIKSILTPEQFANITVKRPVLIAEPSIVSSGPFKYENRQKELIKTIEVKGDSVKLEFYDNGAVDGDSISVFYNNKLIVQHLMLTERPAAFTVPLIDKINEIIMYAENLGTEPPNTALLVVTDKTKHFEIDVSSDLKKSGTIYLKKL